MLSPLSHLAPMTSVRWMAMGAHTGVAFGTIAPSTAQLDQTGRGILVEGQDRRNWSTVPAQATL